MAEQNQGGSQRPIGPGGSGGGDRPNPVRASERARDVTVTIEVVCEKSRNLAFAPTQEVLRGRWRRLDLVGVSTQKWLQDMPEVPGMFVEIDTEKKAARVYDPLGLPENAKLLAETKAAMKASPEGRKEVGPWEQRVYANLGDDQMKTWLYWMRRAVNDGCAQVVTGTLPEMDDILGRPGKTRIEQWNQSTRTKRYLEDALAAQRE